MIWRGIRRVAVILMLSSAASFIEPSHAQTPAQTQWFDSLSYDTRIAIQIGLTAMGHYEGMVDAEFGPLTAAAIRQFQNQNGFPDTGILTTAQKTLLDRQTGKFFHEIDFSQKELAGLGMSSWLPLKLVPRQQRLQKGIRFSSGDSSITLDFIKMPSSERDIDSLYYEYAAKAGGDGNQAYHVRRGNFFVASRQSGDKQFYVRFETNGSETAGFIFTWQNTRFNSGGRVAALMANVFAPFKVAAVEKNKGPEPKPAPSKISAGSAILVSGAGHLLTNNHVVDGCTDVIIGDAITARIAARDSRNDLALLKATTTMAGTPIKFAQRNPKLGEEVVAVGFPLQGVLGAGMNVTGGNVSGLSGLGNDSAKIQFTAPIQPGNSGGALLDRRGGLAGIVTGKLNELTMLKETGSLPQGVNFAVRKDIAASFLESQGVEISTADSDANRSIAELAEQAKTSVYAIVCR